MDEDNAWDWPLLLYAGTVILRRSEKEFWRMTPRKLRALFNVHVEVNKTDDKKSDNRKGYIDEVIR